MGPVTGKRVPASGSGRSRWLRPGLLAVSALVVSALAPSAALALEPCDAGVPTGEVVYKGAFTYSPLPASSRALKKAGIRLRPISPATALSGEQELPVSSVSWVGNRTIVRLAGGLRLERGGRSVDLDRMRIVLRPNVPRAIVARAGSRELRIFTLNRTRVRKARGRISEIELTSGAVRLTGAAARLFRSRLGLERSRRGVAWGRPDLFVRGAGGGDLVGELPPEAPAIEEPAGASPIQSGTIRWRIRESFVNYLTSGGLVQAVTPATPGDPLSFEDGPELVYHFEMPLASGWVTDGAGEPGAVVRGSGGIWFRLCRNTINFTLTSPELVLDGDSSRLIVRARGTDGTPYDGRRVTVLRVFPSRAESDRLEGDQRIIEGMPAYVAEGATGVFLSYPAFPGDLDDPAARLSRFGSVSVSYAQAGTG